MIVYILAVWRLSNLLVKEAGPGRIFHILREKTGITHAGDYDEDILSIQNDWTPLHCIYCTSMYVAAALWFAPSWFLRLMAGSAGATLISEVVEWLQPKQEHYSA